MLNVATPVAPGPLTVMASPGGAPPDNDVGLAFAQALDRASTAATAGDATEADLLRALDPAAVQPQLAEARPGATARGGNSRKADLAEALAEAQVDTPLVSAAPELDEALPAPERRTDESTPVADDAQAAELLAWAASLPLPPPAAAVAPTQTQARPATARADTTAAVDTTISVVASTPTLPALVETPAGRDSVPPAPATLAMPQAASARKADTPSARSPAPGISEIAATRGDVVSGLQALAAQRETRDAPARTTPDNVTVLPAMPGNVANPLPRPGDAGTPLQAELHAELGSKEFAPALGSQLKVLVRDGVEHAQLKLNPAEMGPIEVRIRIDGSQAQVEFSAAQAPTRQALQEAVPALASALRDSGLTLSGGGVFEQARDSRGDAQPQARQGTAPNGERTFDESAPLPQVPRMTRARGAVDLYA